jgi:ATP-dependent RNA helicase DHX37/DHR1
VATGLKRKMEGGEEEDADQREHASRVDLELAEQEAAMLQARRQSAAAAHARLRCQDSDALSALQALCAFEASGESDEFCK